MYGLSARFVLPIFVREPAWRVGGWQDSSHCAELPYHSHGRDRVWFSNSAPQQPRIVPFWSRGWNQNREAQWVGRYARWDDRGTQGRSLRDVATSMVAADNGARLMSAAPRMRWTAREGAEVFGRLDEAHGPNRPSEGLAFSSPWWPPFHTVRKGDAKDARSMLGRRLTVRHEIPCITLGAPSTASGSKHGWLGCWFLLDVLSVGFIGLNMKQSFRRRVQSTVCCVPKTRARPRELKMIRSVPT
jgi:hypothetical protein